MTDTTTLAALESRLAKLERRNRLLTACLAAALAIGVFTAAKTASQPGSFSEVRANRFMLLDEKGRQVGEWAATNGYPELVMRTDLYGSKLRLGEDKDGNYLRMHHKSGSDYQLATSATGTGFSMGGPAGTGSYASLVTYRQRSGFSMTAPNRAQIQVSPGDYPIESIKPGGLEKDWYFTRGSLNLNGMNLYLRRADGSLIQTLPERRASLSAESAEKRFPLFGPRR